MFLKKRIIATAAVIAMAAAAVYGSTQEMSQTQESGSGLQLFRGKETIYCWYSDETLSGYINAAAVSFGEQNSGVRVIPVLLTVNIWKLSIRRPCIPIRYRISTS